MKPTLVCVLIGGFVFATPAFAADPTPPPLPEVTPAPTPPTEPPPKLDRGGDTAAPPPSTQPPTIYTPPPPSVGTESPAESLPPERPEPPKPLGFGRRASFVFSIENVLGIANDSISESGHSETFETNGFFPGIFGPRVGFHGISSGGITYGAGLALGHETITMPGEYGSRDSYGFLIFSIVPRLGYAAPLGPTAGIWIRGGASLHVTAETSHGSDSGYFAGLGGEAYLVFTPSEHFGLLVGPSVDFGIAGDPGGGSHDTKLNTFSIDFGLLADL